MPLDERQSELRDRLAELQRKLKGLGMKGEKGFNDAQGDMKEAEGDLSGDQGQGAQGKSGKPNKGAAVDAQGRALEALREGAQGLSKQMSQGQGQGQNGKGRYVARRTRPGEQPGADPLGRGAEGDNGRDDGPLKQSAGAAERARRVMEELRRRLADPSPPDRRARLSRAADEARQRRTLTRRSKPPGVGVGRRHRGTWGGVRGFASDSGFSAAY